MVLSISRHRRKLTLSQDNYLDAYLRVITQTDPTKTSLVFSCGMGAVRTTFAMVAACLVRRKQVMEKGFDDPFGIKPPAGRPASSTPVGASIARSGTPIQPTAMTRGGATPDGRSTPVGSQVSGPQKQSKTFTDHRRRPLSPVYWLR